MAEVEAHRQLVAVCPLATGISPFLLRKMDREERNGIPWRQVAEALVEWASFLRRELSAQVELERVLLSLPNFPSPRDLSADEGPSLETIEPTLEEVEEAFLEVVELEFATSDQLSDLRSWIEGELADLRVERRRQSQRGFRLTVVGIAVNLGMKFVRTFWTEMAPDIEELLQAIRMSPLLGGGA